MIDINKIEKSYNIKDFSFESNNLLCILAYEWQIKEIRTPDFLFMVERQEKAFADEKNTCLTKNELAVVKKILTEALKFGISIIKC